MIYTAKKVDPEKQKVSFSKKIIVLMFVTMILFTISMIGTFWFRGSVPDELIDKFFGFFGLEGGALGIIKVGETWADRITVNKKKKGDE